MLKVQCYLAGGGLGHDQHGAAIINKAVLKVQCCLAGGGLGRVQHGVAVIRPCLKYNVVLQVVCWAMYNIVLL